MIMFEIKKKITDKEVGPAWQRQSGARAERYSLFLFGLIEQDQELEENVKCYSPFTSIHY